MSSNTGNAHSRSPQTQSISVKTTPPSSSKRKLEVDTKAELQPSKKNRTYDRHETYWIVDGNVLLQFGTTRFKVHKSRLASQSRWFKSLFGRKAGQPSDNDFEDQVEIDDVVSTSEVVDGLDLFHIDYPDDTDADDFAELLKCMDDAVSYLKNEPDFPTINRILNAAYFFRFDSYTAPLEHLVRKMFPDEPEKVGLNSLPHAVEALNFGRFSKSLASIVRCTFYQLARSPPNTLKDVRRRDLELLVGVQRELALAWESIVPIAELNCDCPKCVANRAPNSAVALRKKYLFDPVFGIQKLIKQDWSSKGFCQAKEKEAIAKLKAERSKIWANLKTWIEVED